MTVREERMVALDDAIDLLNEVRDLVGFGLSDSNFLVQAVYQLKAHIQCEYDELEEAGEPEEDK